MTATEYRAALSRLGLSQAGAAELLGISLRASHGYANGEPVPQPIAILLRLLTGELKVRDILGDAA